MTVTPTRVAVPPQNIEAEESVLGAMLLAEPAVDAVTVDVHLKPDDFYRDSHRLIFEAIIKLSHNNAGVDPLTVSAELDQQGRLEAAGGKAYVYQLASAVPTAANARHYARSCRNRRSCAACSSSRRRSRPTSSTAGRAQATRRGRGAHPVRGRAR